MQRWLMTVLAATVLLAWAGSQDAVSGASDDVGERVLLEGTYRWTQGGGGSEPIQVALERTGEDTWEGVFEFRFGGRDRVWRGTLTGDPIEGELKGEVTSGRGRRPRTWLLEGRSQGGVLEATHRERLRSGRLQATGTINVRVVD